MAFKGPADELGQYLGSGPAGLALTLGTNLFVGRLPDQPDNCVAVYETGGTMPLMVIGTPDVKIDRPGFQVRVRDESYTTGEQTITKCFKALQGVYNTTLISGGGIWKLLYATHSPMSIGRDAKQRHEFT